MTQLGPSLSREKTVAVFGGSGFVGRALVTRLLKDGWRVRCATRRTMLAQDVAPMADPGQFFATKADISNRDEVANALEGVDVAINLVGILFESGASSFDSIQHHGAGIVAEECVKHDVGTLVHMSAIGADAESDSAYARSKAQGEAAVFAAMSNAVVLRPSVIYGRNGGAFALFERLSRISPMLPLIGGGRTRWQPVHVADVVDAVMVTLRDGATAGGTYELGGDAILSFQDAMRVMLSALSRRRALVPIPWAMSSVMGACFGLMPKPLLTLDQVRLLREHNVVSDHAVHRRLTLEGLGIRPRIFHSELPELLRSYA